MLERKSERDRVVVLSLISVFGDGNDEINICRCLHISCLRLL